MQTSRRERSSCTSPPRRMWFSPTTPSDWTASWRSWQSAGGRAPLGRPALLVAGRGFDYEHERSALIRRFSIMTTNPSVFARSLALQAGWEDTLSAVIAERIGSGYDDGGITARLLASAAGSHVRIR
ncbi:MAG: hypothetical protein R2789_02135 [Microthrixaceae bacterium]